MNILLISMPFASAHFASMGLSSLSAVLARAGIACDIRYLNLAFRNFVKNPEPYDELTEHYLLGEWVFGRELFGAAWADSRRGGLSAISVAIRSDRAIKEPESLIDQIWQFRQSAGVFLDRCMAAIESDNYDIIGFTSVFDQQIASLALAQRIKARYPEKTIVFGGANCQAEMGQAMMQHFPFVDWVISGDGEDAFMQTIKRFCNHEPLAGIAGLTYRENNSVIGQGTSKVMDLNELPYPDFSDYFQAIAQWAPDLKDKVPLSIELSRGCWSAAKSQCIFCGIHSQLNAYRHKSPERAVQEIKDLVTAYGVADVWVIDSNLPLNYYKTVLPALSVQAQKLDGFFVETKATIEREKLQILKQTGATAFQPGIESLNTEMLQYMCKGTTLLQNIRLLKWAREYGLPPAWNFIHSFPGENPDAYQQMAALVPYLVHLQPPIHVGPVILQRFSPLYVDLERWKLSGIRASQAYEFVYPFAQEELNQLAYTFACDETANDSPADYLTDVTREIMLWKELWHHDEPPLLAYAWTDQGDMVVYDTRPIHKHDCTHLERPLALALQACDTGATLTEISAQVKNDLGVMNYPGDRYLLEGMELLEIDGFILREKDSFLSLVYPLEAYRKNNESFLAYLLERSQKKNGYKEV